MVSIVSGTNRLQSSSFQIVKELSNIYLNLGEKPHIIDLKTIPFEEILKESYPPQPGKVMKEMISQIENSKAVCFVFPEYKRSFPGILKIFIDHWKEDMSGFPPVSLISLGGQFGGVSAMDQLSLLFLKHNIILYPRKLCLVNVEKMLKNKASFRKKTLPQLTVLAKGFLEFAQKF